MSPDRLWEMFSERISALGGKLAALEDLAALAGRRAWADADALPHLTGIPCEWVEEIWESEVGFTLGERAVAESGSLLIANGPGRRRMASLAPEIHVCLVPRLAIVETLEEALRDLPERSCVLVTGSSRTADIEGVLVRGVHGPREVWAVPL